MSQTTDKVMTEREVADYLRFNHGMVYCAADERKRPTLKVDATWRFKRANIEAWIAAKSADPASGENMGGKHAR